MKFINSQIDKKTGNAIVKENLTTKYFCTDFRVRIPINEYYDSKTSIDAVNIRVNGDRAKDIKPEYDYYSVSGIFYSDARACRFELPLEKKTP